MSNEADTCRKFVVPKLVTAGWDTDPHAINEQLTFTDGGTIPSMPKRTSMVVPGPMPGVEEWRITAPWLKLSLKYGLVGPWKDPNWSVAFDRYAVTRGPSLLLRQQS